MITSYPIIFGRRPSKQGSLKYGSLKSLLSKVDHFHRNFEDICQLQYYLQFICFIYLYIYIHLFNISSSLIQHQQQYKVDIISQSPFDNLKWSWNYVIEIKKNKHCTKSFGCPLG